MAITIEIDEEKLLRDIMESYPEYSFCLRCARWNYEKMEFLFCDDEEKKDYKVGMPELKKGLQTLISIIDKHPGGFSSKCFGGYWTDPGAWDAVCTDALVQCAIFGKVIYG